MFTLKYPRAQAILIFCLIIIFLPALNHNEVAATGQASGAFAFFDFVGNAVGTPTVFNNDITGQVAGGNLNNNQFIIAYSSGVDSQGKFAIYDNLGNVVVPAKVFNTARTEQVSVAVLNNNNIWLTFNNDNEARGAYTIYDANGAEVKALTNFTDNTVSDLAMVKMADGNVLILYTDGVANQGFYAIYNPDGAIVKAATLFSTTKPANLAVTLLSNNNIFVAYSDSGNANVGTYFIIDQAGNLYSNPALFSATDTGSISVTSMSNDRVMIVYADNGDNNVGKFVIYNRLGYLARDMISFTSKAIGTIHSSALRNNNVIITYGNPDVSTSTTNLTIYNNNGVQFKIGTVFADQLASSLFTLQLSNFNQLVIYNSLMDRVCTAEDWFAKLSPETCPISGQQTKVWEKNGICAGGITYPAVETISCTSVIEPVVCQDADWSYDLRPEVCPAPGRQTKFWSKTKECANGISHPDNEQVACNYVSPSPAKINIINRVLYKQLRGRIVLKVQGKGEAYYIDSKSFNMYYLGRPADAFRVMREQGIGISNADLAKIPVAGVKSNPVATNFSRQQTGKILLQIQSHGEAWYVNPVDGLRYYLGRPADAFALMRSLGLGISNNNLDNLQK